MNKRVVVKITGGLGNQMFQYATGRSIAIKNRANLLLDTRFYNTQKCERNFSLASLNVVYQEASTKDLQSFIGVDVNSRIVRLFINSILAFKKYIIYKERSLYFNERLKRINHSVYLEGNFMSEQYFLDIKSILIKDFSAPMGLNSRESEILKLVKKSNTVGIHIRRGDYVQNPHTNAYHGVSPNEYYLKAIDYISKEINGKPFLIFFSDDIEWVKKNYSTLDTPAYYVEPGPVERDFADLLLMSRCQHQIIANSTFSWWAAWLNQNPDKVVIAPHKWFGNGKKQAESITIVPPSWIKL